jgi:hypothetical protein
MANIGTFSGVARLVTVTGTTTGNLVGTATADAISWTITISAALTGAGQDPLVVDLDADASGNIKSLKVDVVEQAASGLAPTAALQLNFPNYTPGVTCTITTV